MDPTQKIEKTHVYKTVPVGPETFNVLDGLRRDVPAANGKTKKESWDATIKRLIREYAE